MRKWGLLNCPVVWLNLKNRDRKRASVCIGGGWRAVRDKTDSEGSTPAVTIRWQPVTLFDRNVQIGKCGHCDLRGRENSAVFFLHSNISFSFSYHASKRVWTSNRKEAFALQCVPCRCAYGVWVMQVGGKQLVLNLKHHAFVPCSRFQGVMCTFLTTWMWREHSEQNFKKHLSFQFDCPLSLLLFSWPPLLLNCASFLSISEFRCKHRANFSSNVSSFAAVSASPSLLSQKVVSTVGTPALTFSFFLLKITPAFRFYVQYISHCEQIASKELSIMSSYISIPLILSLVETIFIYSHFWVFYTPAAKAECAGASSSLCVWVCDRGITCLGQLSHRKHSSVRRHRFLSSRAIPLPTPLPEMSFSFSTSSDVRSCLVLNDLRRTWGKSRSLLKTVKLKDSVEKWSIFKIMYII